MNRKNVQVTVVSALVILFFSVIAVPAVSENPEALFQQANRSYSRGEYEQASRIYLQIVKKYGMSSSLLYNLGNSYGLSGQPGRAIASYERALRLDPGNRDARYNLTQIRKDYGLYLENRPFHEKLAGLLSPDQWILLAASGLLVCGLTVFATALRPGLSRSAARTLIISSLFLVLITLPQALLTYRHWSCGVVIAPNVRLLISPFAGAASVGTLKEGRIVIPDRQHDNYIHVTDETGQSGWLDSTVIAWISKPPNINSSIQP